LLGAAVALNAQSSITVTVPSDAGPWNVGGGLNAAYPYSFGGYGPPVVVSAASGLGFNPGDTLTFTYLDGLATVYCEGGCGYWHNANGDFYTFSNGYGTAIDPAGMRFPAYYINAGTALGGLVGVFADDTGALVGSPEWVGVGPTTLVIPSGATQFQLGINDDLYGDNAGSFTIRVDGSSSTGPAAPTNVHANQLGNSGTTIQLTWNYGSDPIDGFTIQRKTPSGTWQTLPTQPTSTDRTFLDAVPSSYGTYSYQIKVYQGNADSAFSDTATAYQLKKLIPAMYNGNTIQALFTPDPTATSVSQSAGPLGYDHFNWVSVITHDPQCYLQNPLDQLHSYESRSGFPAQGPVQYAPHLDPPPGGYVEYGLYPGNLGPSDDLPYLWDEEQPWYLDPAFSLNPGFNIAGAAAGGPQGLFPTASFRDAPSLPCLPGSTPTQSTEYWGFYTSLVGIKNTVGGGGQPPNYTVLASFSWNTTYNGQTGVVRTLNVDPVSGGNGAIFNVADINVNDTPVEIRQLLIQTGAQGISTAPYVDTTAPMTASFLSGPQGTNGWYTGAVTVSLIATDIDGPSDVAASSYNIDGSGLINYASPFTVSGGGIHTIQFGSVDLAGNVETPRPSQTIKVDATPPNVTCSANPTTLWPPNGNPVAVTVAGAITDATSGVDSTSATLAVTDEYGQVQPTGRVTVGAGGTYSFGISLIASRNGSDLDGRTYTIVVGGKDNAGNTGSCSTVLTVPHDQGQ